MGGGVTGVGAAGRHLGHVPTAPAGISRLSGERLPLMRTSLVTTKLRIPPQPFRVVRRERLMITLEHEIPHFKIILLSMPHTTGKQLIHVHTHSQIYIP